MDTNMNRAELIAAREYMGLEQREVAVRLGVVVRTVRRWERGEMRVPPAAAAQIRSWMDETDAAVDELAASTEPNSVIDVDRDYRGSWSPQWQRRVAQRVARRIPGVHIRFTEESSSS